MCAPAAKLGASVAHNGKLAKGMNHGHIRENMLTDDFLGTTLDYISHMEAAIVLISPYSMEMKPFETL